jgi:hypothetical protein
MNATDEARFSPIMTMSMERAMLAKARVQQTALLVHLVSLFTQQKGTQSRSVLVTGQE